MEMDAIRKEQWKHAFTFQAFEVRQLTGLIVATIMGVLIYRFAVRPFAAFAIALAMANMVSLALSRPFTLKAFVRSLAITAAGIAAFGLFIRYWPR